MGKSTITATSGILAGFVGGGIFLVFWLLVGVPLIPSLLIGAAAYGAGLLVFRRQPRAIAVDTGGAPREIRETALREGEERVAVLKGLSARISATSVRRTCDEVVSSAQRILEDLKKNPKDIRTARQFLSYYLDATVKIVARYVELAGKNLDDASIKDSLARAESMLQMISGAFEKQHARLLEDDVMDLDAEMTLLKQTLSMEGLGPQEDGKK